jgi:hypothetical protein
MKGENRQAVLRLPQLPRAAMEVHLPQRRSIEAPPKNRHSGVPVKQMEILSRGSIPAVGKLAAYDVRTLKENSSGLAGFCPSPRVRESAQVRIKQFGRRFGSISVGRSGPV